MTPGHSWLCGSLRRDSVGRLNSANILAESIIDKTTLHGRDSTEIIGRAELKLSHTQSTGSLGLRLRKIAVLPVRYISLSWFKSK